jgi:hypothetical protein
LLIAHPVGRHALGDILPMSGQGRFENDPLCRMVAVACACVLGTILIAGLWPFHAPANDVRWLRGENGIRFGHRGIVASERAFSSASADGPCSLEIVLRPGRISGSGTILALDDFPNPNYVFALRQFDAGLVVQRPAYDGGRTLLRQWWKTDGVFAEGKRSVLTITSDGGRTALYVDGIAANSSSAFGMVSGDLTGRLVLGNAVIQDRWSGDVMGLALYDGALTPVQAKEHADRWLRAEKSVAPGEPNPLALYTFDERSGTLLHDKSGNNNLLIRARYFVLHPGFLTPVWVSFRSRWDGWMTWSYWSDVLVNVAGFVPFGFFFALWFSLMGAPSRPRLTTFVLGVAISLGIEAVQYFLPTRDSSMTDLLTNSIGTAIGVALCRPVLLQRMMIWGRTCVLQKQG